MSWSCSPPQSATETSAAAASQISGQGPEQAAPQAGGSTAQPLPEVQSANTDPASASAEVTEQQADLNSGNEQQGQTSAASTSDALQAALLQPVACSLRLSLHGELYTRRL